ncbi:putative VQ motif-containing protein/14 [Helianthus annuus]|uniref:Putative hydroxyproline-rich glycoprotein family protein n=1 Tax=Helianthus annuus TaxID=4232 RepID=A0A251SY84_HELAN|nr:protein HAIKU1 [Helianthus annuus]KAF5774625.1 putative VQ motif-containing protein 5/9/14 [Helianthus annuus]KAJ0477952.1 putative VQ motif-containing protein/14 [Helianthus annuus]KAJ0498782.1 putative VQ motif-containing protein/14 [Helianthus annuus]KAJ0664802.1 putative VQ motif-containing protein/14 [Helianthus annuus]KAJ0672242.1 putative VQ motif-containing protein/14 [Helianthus annuus]
MDNSDYSRNRGNDYLGVNKIGKNIRKSPLHQPNFANPARQQPQPQVYNINKNDFQSIVQQLTGSPSRQSQEPVPRPPHNSPRPPSMRLQRNRPSPLTPLNVSRPRMAVHHMPPQEQMPPQRPINGAVHGAYNGGSNLARPPYNSQQRPPPPAMAAPPGSGDHTGWSNTAESPISAYMRYLQHSIIDSTQGPPQPQANPQYNQNHQGQSQMQSQPHQQPQHQQQSSGLIPYPLAPSLPSPRMNGPPPLPSHRMNGGPGPPLPPLPSPRMNGPPPPLPSPRMNGPPPPLHSPRMNGPPPPLLPPLPSPTSQFLLPSPTGYLNLLSPRSPYPLLSPGYQHPPPLTPNFSFSPMTQPGMFGSGPQPPPSPGMGFPSPGFFSISSPRWRD